MSKTSQRAAMKMRRGYQPQSRVGTHFTRRHFFPLLKIAFAVLFRGEAYVQLKDSKGVSYGNDKAGN